MTQGEILYEPVGAHVPQGSNKFTLERALQVVKISDKLESLYKRRAKIDAEIDRLRLEMKKEFGE